MIAMGRRPPGRGSPERGSGRPPRRGARRRSAATARGASPGRSRCRRSRDGGPGGRGLQLVDDRAAVLSEPRRAQMRELILRDTVGLGPARGAAGRPGGRGGDGQRARRASTSSAAAGSSATAVAFASERALRNAIERILAPLGRRVDELSPMVDARLADGSRVNVVIPPLAVDGPAVSIRRFGARAPRARRAGAIGTLDAPSSASCWRGAVAAAAAS